MEIWRKITGYNYEVSNFGNVRNFKTKHIMRPQNSWNGYSSVTLRMGTRSRRKKFLIHRLVAEYFLPNIERKPEVNHKDLNKRNNHYENLEWVTKQENMDHAKSLGVMARRKGEDHNCNKLTEKDVISIRSATCSYKELADKFDVHIRTISRIKNRESWTHI